MAAITQHEHYLAQLPEDWVRTTIAALGDIAGGGTPARGVKAFWGGDVPWITPGEISDCGAKFVRSTRERITKAGLTGSGANLLPPGSLMVTTRATLGARVLNSVPMATNQGFRSIVFRRREVPDFYYYLFEKLQSELRRRASGTTFLEISGAEFGRIEVPSPCSDEKATIALVLDTLDTAIRQTEAIIDKLKQVKQGLLHDLLTRGIDENGELRPPQSEAPHIYKQSPLGWIPKAWSSVELHQLVDRERPIVYGILMPGYGFDGGVPVVKVKDIVDGEIDVSNLLLTSPKIDREYERSRLKGGDLLFTIRGTVGRTAFVPPQLEMANITQDTARLSIVGSHPRFVREYLGTSIVQRFIETHTIGVAVRGINLRDVRRIPIALPSAKEAVVVSRALQQSGVRQKSEMSRLTKLQVLKRGLLDDLLTGSVRVTPLLKE